MRIINEQELKDILDKHGKWLRSEPGGERADLSYANLSYANLNYADLRYADLSSADLRFANLRFANLSSANLSSANLSSADLRSADLRYANMNYANLRYADLRYADLEEIKKDFIDKLLLAKNEAAGLYDYLQKGLVDGSQYEGECACFVGTLAKVAKESHKSLSSGVKPDSGSPSEIWFFTIRKGDTPLNNQTSKITCEWIEEFAKEHGIELPQYKIVSSLEAPEELK